MVFPVGSELTNLSCFLFSFLEPLEHLLVHTKYYQQSLFYNYEHFTFSVEGRKKCMYENHILKLACGGNKCPCGRALGKQGRMALVNGQDLNSLQNIRQGFRP